ncbi:hypothetical protein BOX15_Mlig004807g1 [Macrostomum lignano]|uniref:Uncharacterized protein n=1 Tax=Macrostomum lignano TaxID=282301 RepID=A0A267DZ64_9PLAT|nr:hypothetical protein BOX15_Mlig004807g1 [Macrostomum lignano]
MECCRRRNCNYCLRIEDYAIMRDVRVPCCCRHPGWLHPNDLDSCCYNRWCELCYDRNCFDGPRRRNSRNGYPHCCCKHHFYEYES